MDSLVIKHKPRVPIAVLELGEQFPLAHRVAPAFAATLRSVLEEQHVPAEAWASQPLPDGPQGCDEVPEIGAPQRAQIPRPSAKRRQG